MLKEMQKRISAGEDPDVVIPWEAPRGIGTEDYIEMLYFAFQVLPAGMRRERIKRTLEELHARGTDSK